MTGPVALASPLPVTAPSRRTRVALVTLGCAKNLVDSEIMAGLMTRGDFAMAASPEEADLAIVNTCAFIGPSQRESIDRILELAVLKREGTIRGLVVAGCLAQRYQADLLAEIPEVDAVVGTGQVDAIVRVANRILRSPGGRILEVGPPGTAVDLARHRAVSTPRHVAYLRIADGCDFRCTFCIIPKLRGDLRSRPVESVVEEAKSLRRPERTSCFSSRRIRRRTARISTASRACRSSCAGLRRSMGSNGSACTTLIRRPGASR